MRDVYQADSRGSRIFEIVEVFGDNSVSFKDGKHNLLTCIQVEKAGSM